MPDVTLMNLRYAAGLIALVQQRDPGHLTPANASPESLEALARIWLSDLDGLPVGWCRDSINDYYRRGHTRLTSTILRREWDKQQHQVDVKRQAVETRQVIEETVAAYEAGSGLPMGLPPWYRPALAAAERALSEGTDPDEATEAVRQSRPEWAENRVPPPALAHQWARERDCGVRGCLCRHERCRAGWMDDVVPEQKCPACETALMERDGERAR